MYIITTASPVTNVIDLSISVNVIHYIFVYFMSVLSYPLALVLVLVLVYTQEGSLEAQY